MAEVHSLSFYNYMLLLIDYSVNNTLCCCIRTNLVSTSMLSTSRSLLDANPADFLLSEEQANRAQARPNAIEGHGSTILVMHDAVDSKPHLIANEESAVASEFTEAFVVGGI